MAQVTVKYKRNRETRTDGIKAWRADRTFTVYMLRDTGACMLGNADARDSHFNGVR